MENLSTREAADLLGVSVKMWHRLTKRYGVAPVGKLTGLRGAMFWSPESVELIRSKREGEAA